MPAHNPETDSTTRAEHESINDPGTLKHLKSLVLSLRRRDVVVEAAVFVVDNDQQ
jgi:hypothetical protein